MSGTNYNSECPRCGGEMICYSDWKPIDSIHGECLDCGFCYWTQDGRMTLEEVNKLREAFGLELLTALKEPREGAE